MLRADWMYTSDEFVFNYTSVWFLCVFDVVHCIDCKYSQFWLSLFSAESLSFFCLCPGQTLSTILKSSSPSEGLL